MSVTTTGARGGEKFFRPSRGAFSATLADIHLWLSLVVGLQTLAWVSGGLFMSLAPIAEVRSEHRLAAPPAIDLEDFGPFIPAEHAAKAAGAPVRKLSLEIVGARPFYVVERGDGESVMVDANSGGLASPIDAAFARLIAEQEIAGEEQAVRVALIEDHAPIEYRGKLPVWRVDFADAAHLSAYVSPETGRILARRSDLWRAYDFLWSLHIMDYRGRENFNHPLLVAFSAAALIMSVIGMILLCLRLPMRLRRLRQQNADPPHVA